MALDERAKIILSHDGARPFVKLEDIEASVEGVEKYGSCVVGVPVTDTIKIVGDEERIDKTPKRSELWAAQTPQAFYKDILLKSYKKAIRDNFRGTDDSSIVERAGYPVKMLMGSYDNIKITTPEDIIVGESIIKDKDKIFDRIDLRLQS